MKICHWILVSVPTSNLYIFKKEKKKEKNQHPEPLFPSSCHHSANKKQKHHIFVSGSFRPKFCKTALVTRQQGRMYRVYLCSLEYSLCINWIISAL